MITIDKIDRVQRGSDKIHKKRMRQMAALTNVCSGVRIICRNFVNLAKPRFCICKLSIVIMHDKYFTFPGTVRYNTVISRFSLCPGGENHLRRRRRLCKREQNIVIKETL